MAGDQNNGHLYKSVVEWIDHHGRVLDCENCQLRDEIARIKEAMTVILRVNQKVAGNAPVMGPGAE